ncbi:NADH dehydrogenase [ubiquinone] flavoprotein 1, mitochondrial [Paramarasmius palmivorus]|uniref:NADH dehydrogenase [ubiquinone] flavoprotein 1, mitochondrial n=1 Tax=Paramarasmius palmivorus TaxID=297713 RepID=A0AAW0CGL4_9AGAR
MANLVRTPKSGNEWTPYELLAYNIKVSICQSSADFFGSVPNTPLSQLDPNFVSGTLDSDGLSDHTYRLLQYLELASKAHPGQESAIDDFTKEILRALGYEERGNLLRSRYAIPFTVCGQARSAKTDICLFRASATILLVVQEDVSIVSGPDTEAQIVANAIAVFQHNNLARSRLGLEEISEMTIPCIAMIRTRPIFFKVPVTTALSDAVISAQYPSETTHISKFVLAPASGRLTEGMEKPEFRKVALQHLDAFRVIAKSMWEKWQV